jgi:alpha-tubulin suppressor-like RCC1 family protein
MVVTKSLARVVLSAAALALGFSLTPASAQPEQGPAQPGQGTVDHWGGYIGTPGQDVHVVPASISLPGQVAEVGTSNSTEYALLTNGTLYAWGGGTRGQLGNGRKRSSNSVPVRVQFPPGVQIASIPTDVMPFDTGLAVDTHGHVWGWGANKDGELCLGTTHPYTTPAELPFSNVSAVAGAGAHATYDAGGTLYSCGSGRYGELGDGSMQNSTTPARVQGLNGQFVAGLVAAFSNEGALLDNGQYVNWGLDSEGQLGNGTVNRSSDVPVTVSLPARVTQVAEGGSLFNNGQTLVLLSDGSLRAWGDGREYQLGNGQKGVFPSPVPFSAPPGVTYTTLATSGNTSYALSADGVVYAWGASNAGQVGDGKKTAARHGAVSLSATANDIAVSVGHHRH